MAKSTGKVPGLAAAVSYWRAKMAERRDKK
jgi:hypothetical protein